MRIARVFPTKTSMSPLDHYSYFGPPELFMPRFDEVHISVAFTWDIIRAKLLAKQWEHIAPVKIGGPAIDGEPTDGFQAGMYLRNGVTITSRGCPFANGINCPWCFVKQKLIELDDFPKGNIIQDNNILACSWQHREKVFQMLSKQKDIQFNGGLSTYLLTDEIIEQLRGLKIYQLFIAYDDLPRRRSVLIAIEKLKKYFKRRHIRCYVLIGFNNDSIKKAEKRLIDVWEMGALPFAMLYRDKRGEFPKPEKQWRRFQRSWSRPAAIVSTMGKK